MIATSSGERIRSPARRPTPITDAIPNDATYASTVTPSRRPRRRSKSISRPASSSRNASPSRLITCTGSSSVAQPRNCGPMTIPRRISSTTAGSGRRVRPSTSGARSATAATTASDVNERSMPDPVTADVSPLRIEDEFGRPAVTDHERRGRCCVRSTEIQGVPHVQHRKRDEGRHRGRLRADQRARRRTASSPSAATPTAGSSPLGTFPTGGAGDGIPT